MDRRSLLLGAGTATVVAGLGAGTIAVAQKSAKPADPFGERDYSTARVSTKYRFNDPDMDLFFVIALAWSDTGGLSPGELFYVAQSIKDGDADSWVTAFQASGERQDKQADEWKAKGWKRQSAQARFKAFASYRSAWQFAPLGAVFESIYAKQQTAFKLAVQDSGLPATFFKVPYKGKHLPGVFLQNPNKNAPVVLCLGGADTGYEETLFTVGRNVFDAGYSVALADLPGQGITMKDDLHWEMEPEKPIGAIVDLLVADFGAKPGHMAMMGYSLGGYWATRAAGHEKRFATVIASTPFPRPVELVTASRALYRQMAASGRRPSTATLRNNAVIYWKAGVPDQDEEQLEQRLGRFVADPQIVTVPFLSIVGGGEGNTFQQQSDSWNAEIRSTRKKLVRLDAATGGADHCQAANRLRLAQEMTGWMDEIFKS
ncbi:alpha/beta hydrolase [Kribbella yunnanensis]|uniref:alpha/beta hydrolase family protein n=1 Tax=Kribbella yunnanensis TaxID=190194 RepID=UPI0031D73E1C